MHDDDLAVPSFDIPFGEIEERNCLFETAARARLDGPVALANQVAHVPGSDPDQLRSYSRTDAVICGNPVAFLENSVQEKACPVLNDCRFFVVHYLITRR